MVGAGHDDAYADQASNVAALYDSAAKVHAAGDLCRLAASDLGWPRRACIFPVSYIVCAIAFATALAARALAMV